jgi:hypothetical protein
LERSPPDWFEQAIALAGRQFVAIAASAEIPPAVFELSLQAIALAGRQFVSIAASAEIPPAVFELWLQAIAFAEGLFAAFAAIPPKVFEHSLQ